MLRNLGLISYTQRKNDYEYKLFKQANNSVQSLIEFYHPLCKRGYR